MWQRTLHVGLGQPQDGLAHGSAASHPLPRNRRTASTRVRNTASALRFDVLRAEDVFGGRREACGILDQWVKAPISSSLHGVIYWRLGVPMALTAAMLRAGGLGHLLGGLVWYALQFGPLVLLGLAQTVGWIKSRGKGNPGPRAVAVLLPALLLAALAAASSLWANDPGQTLRQAGLLAIVFLFLLST